MAFGGVASQEIFGGNLFKRMAGGQKRITMLLDFGSCFARNLGGNLFKEWPGQKRITMLLDFGSCFARCFGVAKTE